jgi:hypothetical protein
MAGMDARRGRQARNEALLREVNERIGDVAGRGGALDLFEFHCECGAEPFCGELVAMTLEEYDAVRAQDDRFAVAPGHETPAIERVVERGERFVIVDKLPAYEELVADDPRGEQSH